MNNSITLTGSVDIVKEFFEYAVNNILYLREIYPEEEFDITKRYGLQIRLAKDRQLVTFINKVLNQLTHWLTSGEAKKLVLVIIDANTKVIRERWNFDIETDLSTKVSSKSEETIVAEIRQIARQISSSVTYLPILSCPCIFDVLMYTAKDTTTPSTWEESGPSYVADAQQVRLRSFDTEIHQVQPMVAYSVSK
eukprot:TRINITY_DN11408_c0_g1_i1.p1 TRINITY_DN11408_c0_g1~~TRINITY_DN11408_c0_g1_i1.p1  ORF type:complete len:212 (+),score=36.01 TRINITY_DN11408_c0_g1_i1:57-638(+)